MNKKGQALVEFVLILPVFLIILLVIVDFGNLLYSKNKLENDSADMLRIIKNETIMSLEEEYPGIKVEINEYKYNYQNIVFTKKIDINTPLLDRILGNPCLITTERIIPNEQ